MDNQESLSLDTQRVSHWIVKRVSRWILKRVSHWILKRVSHWIVISLSLDSQESLSLDTQESLSLDSQESLSLDTQESLSLDSQEVKQIMHAIGDGAKKIKYTGCKLGGGFSVLWFALNSIACSRLAERVFQRLLLIE